MAARRRCKQRPGLRVMFAAAEYCAHARLFVPVPVATVAPKRSRAAVTVQVPLPLPPVPLQLPSSLIVSAHVRLMTVMVAATVPAVERTAIVSLLFVFFHQDRSSTWWHSWVSR